MKQYDNFTGISQDEAYSVMGGQSPEIAKLIRWIGYGIGRLIKHLSDIFSKDDSQASVSYY